MKRFTKRIVALLCMMAIVIGTCATTSLVSATEEIPEGLEPGGRALTIVNHSTTCTGGGAFELSDTRNGMNYSGLHNMEFNGKKLTEWILVNGTPISCDINMRSQYIDLHDPTYKEGDTIEFVKGMPFPLIVDAEGNEIPVYGMPMPDGAKIVWKDYLSEGYKVQLTGGVWVKVAAAGSENSVVSGSAVTETEATEVDPALVTFQIKFELPIVDAETYDLEDQAAYADNIYLNGKSIAAINAEKADTVTLSAYLDTLTVNVAAESALISAKESFELKIGKEFVSTTGMIMTADYVRHYLPELAYWSTLAPSDPVKTEPLRFASGKAFEMIDLVNGVYQNGAFDFTFATDIADQQYLAYNFHPDYLATLPPAYQSTKDAASELAAGGYLANLLEHVEVNGKTIAQMWEENADKSAEFKSSMYQIHILGSTLSVRAANSTFNTDKDMTIVLKAGLVFYKGKYLENDIKVVYTAADQKTVYTIDTQSVAISADKTTLEIGETAQLTATITPADATGEITYESSDTAVATVDENGLVTAVAAGTATITAKFADKSATIDITVNAASVPATGIEVSAEKTSIKVGETTQLTATITPDGATDTVTYESSDTSIATVDEDGKVTALKAGEVTITVKAGSVSDTITITVTAADEGGETGGDDSCTGCSGSASAMLLTVALGAVMIIRKR